VYVGGWGRGKQDFMCRLEEGKDSLNVDELRLQLRIS
jgi:hypothetical protein